MQALLLLRTSMLHGGPGRMQGARREWAALE
eukprot:CAMPEP_0206620716 /NCGR_PEP_ID=MMETSP0325_2-20121206/61781_1 /ASSEMBLY_ACC=CAM_ASM_000347 /TAXON_ID=2866 /ORGANISM="Crypthecodinium cohnii, Strain Seligo" /LENGTH=30 /DNA_ID= /DNA_START= /DNA_END= /DNA_ORIENTATION=